MEEIVAVNREFHSLVAAWVAPRVAGGAHQLVIEGLPQSGKTTLARALASAFPGSSLVHLDDVLPKGLLNEESWTEAVVRLGGAKRILAALQPPAGLTIIDGACALEVLEKVVPDGIPAVMVYVKRLSTAGGVPDWSDGEWLDRKDDQDRLGIVRSRFMQSIDDYHRSRRPWLTANLIASRLDDE